MLYTVIRDVILPYTNVLKLYTTDMSNINIKHDST